MPLIIPSNSITGGYEVANSLRFDDGSSDSLTKTQGTPTNSDICTFSFWFKLGSVVTTNDLAIIFEYYDVNNYFGITKKDNDRLQFFQYDGGSLIFNIQPNRLFRDHSAWYHVVIAYDSSQSTSSDRIKIYVNGVEETSFNTSTYPSQNADIRFNTNNQSIKIGQQNSNLYFDGYMAEVVFIDGQALDPTSFGEFDEDSSVWKPIDVSGLSFGSNGFYLPFENSGALGQDDSGNGNNFTVNNLTSIDQTTDTCTNNFTTLNSIIPHATPILYKDGNTIAFDSTANFNTAFSSLGISTGKWYFEAKTSTNNGFVGICKSDEIFPAYTAGVYLGHADLGTNSWGYYADSGNYFHNGSSTAYGNSWTNTDLIGCALDLDNNKLYFSKNGTWQNSGDPTSGATGTGAISITSGTYLFGVTKDNESSEMQCNFGNPPFTITSGNSDGNGYGNFEYSVPSGYYSLNSKNLAEYG